LFAQFHSDIAFPCSNVDQPMQLAVSPAGDVFFIERTGALKKYVTAESKTVLVGTLNVSTDVEDGLLGIALDPSFESTGWIYLYYSPKAVIQSCLARFTVQNNLLDLNSESRFFCVDTQRKECCHSAGSLKYDYSRNLLYLSLGDNTSPYGDSDSFAPLDERPGRAFFDSQRTAANTMDLRGKILRIIPYQNGSYDAPADNLFVQGPIRGRKEIFVMGVRNPFRYTINPATGVLYWAEVGPNSDPNPARGPRGVDEVNMAETAGNYGWPYCIGPNEAYRNWNFADKTSSRNFDCSRPTNLSPNRDKGGSETLPPARPAMIWYGYTASKEFPEITEGITSAKTPGRCGMLGPYYQHLVTSSGVSLTTGVLPVYFNNTAFFMEWRREYIMELKMDSDGKILKLNHIWSTFEWRGPIDMAISPDGWIYVAEYGTDFEGLVRPARITRIRYTTKPRVPECSLVALPSSGRAPLRLLLSAAASTDPAGLNLTFSWNLPGALTDSLNSTGSPNTTASYAESGVYSAKVTVRNSMGSESTCSASVVVGNTAPQLSFRYPPFGAVYSWGSKVPYQVVVEDAEDGSSETGAVDCSLVEVQPQLGHDNHYHSLVSQQGCKGEVQTLISGHEGDVDLFYALEARYTDLGAGYVFL
jgi:cytochrome c